MLQQTFETVIEELYMLHKLHKQLVSVKQPMITLEQGKLLYLLKDKKMNQKELALALHITEATLSVRIKRLLDNGYIERTVDQNDKRIYLIGLSLKGQQEILKLVDDVKHYHQCLSKNVTQEELETILRVIHKMQENIKGEMK